jgi:calcium-dependent protein kinase
LFQGPAWESVSDEAIDFISKLLSYEQWKRPTAKQALQRPWIQYVAEAQAEVVQKRDAAMTIEAMCHLFDFSAPNKLQQAALIFISYQLVEKDDKEAIDKVFQALDVSGSGKLSREDIQSGFFNIFDVELPNDAVEELFDAVDVNGTNYIEYTEFVMAALSRDILLRDDNLKKTFRCLTVMEAAASRTKT